MSGQIPDNSKEFYTYIAIPVDALKPTTENNVQLFTINSNLLKELPNNEFQEALPMSSNENVATQSLSCTDVCGKSDYFEILNLSPSTGEKLAIVLQNSLISSATNQLSKSSKTQMKNTDHESSEPTHSNSISPEIPNNTVTGNKVPTFQCAICKDVFDKLNIFKKHMELHAETKRFKCKQCSASYHLEENLKVHMVTHNNGEPFCPICNRKFLRLASLKSHLTNHQLEEIFTCYKCLAEFENETDFIVHTETRHKKGNNKNSTEMSLVCMVCSHSFENAKELKEHVLHHIKMKQLVKNGKKSKKRMSKTNKGNKANHICNICKKTFSKYCILERHLRIHTGEKPYVCHLCNSAFNQKGTLQIHLLRHSGTKPFKCYLCSAKFIQKCNLRVHLQKTHTVPGPNEKIFKCTLCTCVFKKISSLSSHITKMHVGENGPHGLISEVMHQLKDLQHQMDLKHTLWGASETLPIHTVDKQGTYNNVKVADTSCEEEIKLYSVKRRKFGQYQWYVCSYCFKEFKKPSDLIRHMRKHTKAKPFKCEFCNQAFSLKSTLKNHLTTHSRVKNFHCVICTKSFTTFKLLNVHLKRHEKVLIQGNNEHLCIVCGKLMVSLQEVKVHMAGHNINRRVKHQNVSNKHIKVELIMQPPMVETPEGLFPVPAPKSSTDYSEEELEKRKFKCTQCKAAFLKQIHLTRHQLIHSKDRKYRCTACPKSFYSSYALKEHSKFHSGQRNYACHLCEKKFITNGILKRHLIVHSKIKPYVCPYCRRHFKTAAFCRKHINIHKKDVSLETYKHKEIENINEIFGVEEPVSDETYFPNDELSKVQNINLQNIQPVDTHLSNDINPDMGIQPDKLVFTDENGIIISDIINNEEIQQSTGFMETPSYTKGDLLRDNLIENDIHSFINTQPFNIENGYSMIYIDCQDLQTLSDSTLYTSDLTEKLTEPMFLNGGSNFNNIIVTTNTVSSMVDESYVNPQNLDNGSPAKHSIVPFSKNSAFSTSICNYIDEGIATLDSKFTINSKESELLQTDIILKLEETNSVHGNKLDGKSKSTKDCVYTCTQCKKSFGEMRDLAKHKCQSDNVTNEDVKNGKLKCEFCSKTFFTAGAHKKHSLVHKNKGTTIKMCSYCQRTFKKQCDLVRHIRVHTGEKPFKCEKCDKSFSLKSTLNCHYKTHNPNSKDNFPCPVCGTSFSFRSSLKVHSRIHTGARPYPCTLCPESFRTSGNRQSHMAVHAKLPESRKRRARKPKINSLLQSIVLDTEVNNQGTSSINNESFQLLSEAVDENVLFSLPNPSDLGTEPLLLHLDMLLQTSIDDLPSFVQGDVDNNEEISSIMPITGDITNNSSKNLMGSGEILLLEEPIQQPHKTDSKDFECDICFKKYSRQYVLKQHKKTHIPHCTSCNEYFDNKESYTEHMKQHIADRTFACHLCANVFNFEKNLKTHLKRIHNIVIV